MTKSHCRTQFVVDSPSGILRNMTAEDWSLSTCAERFFLSEIWLKTWLESLPESVTLVMVKMLEHAWETPSTVALAIFGISFRRSLWHRQMQWNLFRTGVPQLDQIWVEDNHVLIKQGYEHIEKAFWHRIKENSPNAEIVIQVAHTIPDFDNALGVEITHKESAPYLCYLQPGVMLKKGIEKKLRALSSLPFDINLVEVEHSVAFDALIKSSVWHIDKWQKTDTPSGFSNPHFVNFHRKLWCNSSPDDKVKPRLYQLYFDKYEALTLYGFQHGQWFGFYCLSQAPQPDNKWRLGLYAHWLLQKKLADEGFVEYDFMAGDDAYKLMLSNLRREAFQLRAYPKTLRHRIENELKKLKAAYDAYKERGKNEKI